MDPAARMVRAGFIEALCGRYHDELEGALCAEYAPRDPLAEFWRGELTPRQLRVHVAALPSDTAIARAQNGNGWTEAEWIAHDTNWQLRQLLALTYNVNSEKGKNAPEPKPLPTPLDEGVSVPDAIEKEQRELQRTEVAAIAAAMFRD